MDQERKIGHKCANCGFLARRPAVATYASTFFEMPERTRRSGGGWWTFQVGGLGTRTVPACCVGAFPILDEIKAVEPDALNWRHKGIRDLTSDELDTYKDDRSDSHTPERTEAAKVVFNKPRKECPQWYQYVPGLGPEKHLELRTMQRLERDSARRDHRSFWAFVFIGIVGLILAAVQIWAPLQ